MGGVAYNDPTVCWEFGLFGYFSDLFYLYAFKWRTTRRVISGFLSFFAGVLLMFQAFFVSSLHLDNNEVKVTFSRIMADPDSSASGELPVVV